MTRCNRFESEALERLERDLDLDPHFDSCADCRKARREYDSLKKALAQGPEPSPPVGWRERVWKLVEEAEEKQRRAWWSRFAVPAAVAAALVLVVAASLVWLPGPLPPSLEMRVEPGRQLRRGTEAQPGDRIVFTASDGGLSHSELRVYFNESQWLGGCASRPSGALASGVVRCSLSGNRLRAEIEVDAPGVYQALFWASDQPLENPPEGLDRDAARAQAAGAVILIGEPVEVR